MRKINWAIFVSGRGSTLQSFLDVSFLCPIGLVVSSNKKAFALSRARRAGVPQLILDHKVDWQKLNDHLRERKITHLFLLGFMKVLPGSFIKPWSGKIFNLHPSLLPLFPGLHGLEKSFESASDVGATIHEVIEELDAGKILLQKTSVQNSKKTDLAEAQWLNSLNEQRLVRKAAFKIQDSVRRVN